MLGCVYFYYYLLPILILVLVSLHPYCNPSVFAILLMYAFCYHLLCVGNFGKFFSTNALAVQVTRFSTVLVIV